MERAIIETRTHTEDEKLRFVILARDLGPFFSLFDKTVVAMCSRSGWVLYEVSPYDPYGEHGTSNKTAKASFFTSRSDQVSELRGHTLYQVGYL